MYTPVFQHIPDDWRERWRLIRTLVARVYNATMPDIGRVPRLPKALKSQLGGEQLPPSVIEWMAFGQDLAKCYEEAGDSVWPYSFQVTDLREFESISLNQYYAAMQWAVAYQDFDQEDPPVSAYYFVQRRNQWVLRKTHRRIPVTQLALHCVLRHTPWLNGWKDYSWRSTGLKDAKGFVEELRKTKGALVSDPFGNVTFVEGNGWVAYVVNGYTHFGPDKFIRLYSSQDARVRDIPKPIRKLFQLTKSSQLYPSRLGGDSESQNVCIAEPAHAPEPAAGPVPDGK